MAGDITQILVNWEQDRNAAVEQLTPLVYAELHKIAVSYMRSQRPDHTLQATALINEAYMRMVRREDANYKDRTHFFALAAKIMRGILVDFARARTSRKRGSGQKVELTPDLDVSGQDGKGADDFMALHEAMEKLKDFDQRKASVLELHYFGGLTFDEIAETLGISVPTTKRDAAFGMAWLKRSLSAVVVAPETAS